MGRISDENRSTVENAPFSLRSPYYILHDILSGLFPCRIDRVIDWTF